MVAWYLLFIPALYAWLNRDWRGDGDTPCGRLGWYGFNVVLAFAVGLTKSFVAWPFAAAWLLLSLGYSVMGWAAMFSATHGKAPGRKDAAYYDWMQTLACKIVGIPRPTYRTPEVDAEGATKWRIDVVQRQEVRDITPLQWRQFGAWYGCIRGLVMLPGIVTLCYVTSSFVPLTGLFICAMGWVYYFAERVRRYLGVEGDFSVPFAEICMGYLLGTYLLIAVSQF